MPKPGNYNKPPTWKKQYNEHDNRGGGGGGSSNYGGDNSRRGTFKHSRQGKRGQGRDWSAGLRAHLEEEDVDMGAIGFATHKRRFNNNNKRGGRSGSPTPNRSNFIKRKLLDGPTGWFRIYIPYGNKYAKDYIVKTLMDNLNPMPFQPTMWTVNGTAATFYIDDFKTAEKLHALDRQLQCPDGFKLIIRVNSGSPNVDVTTSMKDKMKVTMAKRYNAATKALDLTRFHADPDFQEHFCALFKPITLLAVIDIIAENIPEIEALNLNDNRIQVLSHLRKFDQKLPNLKILHLGNNKIREMSMLDSLTGLQLIDFVLDGNPVCDKYRDRESYIREIRKRFPKVVKLDGIDLPPPISFDITEASHLPASQQTFLCNSDGQGIVRQFLEQYFLIFDSDARQPLLQAYHEHAIFSMTMTYPYGQHPKNASWLNWYSTDNRNIMRVRDSERREKLLKQGQLAIVSFLNEMPSSKHDIHSFTVDLTLFTPQMLLLTVTGIFRELRSGHKTPPLRYFCRTLLIVPAGSGFCIANEQLHISNATDEQAKVAFKTPIVAPVVVPTAPAITTSPVIPAPSTSLLDDNTKQQMVQTMALQSGMNLEWSQKCLEETSWDFNRAAFVFTELQKQGTIPAEAFVK